MDYFQRIQNSIEFIEENIQSELSIIDISARAFFSPFHFQRLFQSISGFSVQEYIRKRRLTESAELLENSSEGILNVALEFGYGSQEAFTRAFKSYFGVSPANYRKLKTNSNQMRKLNFLNYRTNLKGEIFMNVPEIVNMNEINIIGYDYVTSLINDRYFNEIPGFYDDFGKNEYYMKIPNRITPAFAYGVACNYMENSEFSFVVGEAVSLADEIILEDGFTQITLPAGKYAEFKLVGSIELARNTWKFIYGTWLPNSNYERAEGPDFEVTDVCGSVNDLKMKIYIPLK